MNEKIERLSATSSTNFIDRFYDFYSRLRLGNKILLGFTVPLSVMVLIAVATYASTRQLISTTAWVAHTQSVIARGEQLGKQILDMETGERGFLITGKDSFLEPYVAAKAAWDDSIRELRVLIQDNPAQLDKINEIDQLEKAWVSEAAEPEILLRRKVQPQSIHLDYIQNVLRQKTGKKILDDIRALTISLNNKSK